jgi:hypothetical protein
MKHDSYCVNATDNMEKKYSISASSINRRLIPSLISIGGIWSKLQEHATDLTLRWCILCLHLSNLMQLILTHVLYHQSCEEKFYYILKTQ